MGGKKNTSVHYGGYGAHSFCGTNGPTAPHHGQDPSASGMKVEKEWVVTDTERGKETPTTSMTQRDARIYNIHLVIHGGLKNGEVARVDLRV